MQSIICAHCCSSAYLHCKRQSLSFEVKLKCAASANTCLREVYNGWKIYKMECQESLFFWLLFGTILKPCISFKCMRDETNFYYLPFVFFPHLNTLHSLSTSTLLTCGQLINKWHETANVFTIAIIYIHIFQ